MNKAFVKESDDDDEELQPSLKIPAGTRNYISPAGHARLKSELEHLVKRERPHVVEIVAWAASNGDRSENGDYIYGKRRLREIDRRLRFLDKRMAAAEAVDPAKQTRRDRVYFGATVTYAREDESEVTVTIVGIDEIDAGKNHISWVSPVARALMKAAVGDLVTLRTPAGPETLEILSISYPA